MLLDYSILSSHSQFGEDILAHHILKDLSNLTHTFLDIGCGHPTEFNNTYFFYNKGWRGVNVDASPQFQNNYAEKRPEDKFLNQAISTETGEITFYEFNPYFYSTCDNKRAKILQAEKQVEFVKEHSISCTTIQDIIEANFPNGQLDLLTIDVEGLENEVLKSNNWTQCRPKIIIVEILGLIQSGGLLHTDAYKYLSKQGYSMKAFSQSSFIFADTELVEFKQHPLLPLGGIS